MCCNPRAWRDQPIDQIGPYNLTSCLGEIRAKVMCCFTWTAIHAPLNHQDPIIPRHRLQPTANRLPSYLEGRVSNETHSQGECF